MTVTNKIVKALTKEPMSAKRLASRYKLNANTTRKCLGWLRANGFISARSRATAQNKSRLIYFTVKRLNKAGYKASGN